MIKRTATAEQQTHVQTHESWVQTQAPVTTTKQVQANPVETRAQGAQVSVLTEEAQSQTSTPTYLGKHIQANPADINPLNLKLIAA